MHTFNSLSLMALYLVLVSCTGADDPSSSSQTFSSANSVNNSSVSAAVSSSPSASSSSAAADAGKIIYAFNVGTGDGFTGTDGIQYTGDLLGYLSDDGGDGFGEDSYDMAVANTSDDVLYQSQRFGLFSYQLPVSNGTYQVTAKLAEFYHDIAGARSIDVWVEGQSIAKGLDLVAAAGQYSAYDVVSPKIPVSDGSLTIQFDASIDLALVSAIVVSSEDGSAVIPPKNTTTIQEGQAGYCSTQSVPVESDHTGYLGDGYANTANQIGYGLEWQVNASATGSVTVAIRFANGGSAGRPGTMTVNNGGTYNVDLPVTSAWTSWQTRTIEISLQQGVNTLVLKANTAEGLANIDSISITGAGVSGNNCAEPPPATNDGTTLAFPGAMGFGRFAAGGRGGSVFHVTNLNDSGPGSLRDAISQPNRIVVFDVGGIIKIKERLVFKNNLTIAGQTAPGDGITVYGNGTSFSGASNTIVRYLRLRMGKIGTSGKDTVSIANGHDIIFDHVSLSWSRDGTFDINPDSGKVISNITLQNSIVGQGLQTHSTGGLMVAGGGASIIRSLYIDNQTRNPKARGILQFVNNVVYNWVVAGYILGDSAGDSGARYDGAMIGNYFISGPETGGSVLKSPSQVYHLYALDNWYDADKNGSLNARLLNKGDYGSVTWYDSPSTQYPYVPTLSAKDGLDYVIANVGASLRRDAVDQYVINELKSWGKSGKTISDEASLGLPNAVGNIAGGTVPIDTDNDGMPDSWENQNNLDPNDPTDAMKDSDGNGWVNIEEYINSLVL